MCDGRCWALAYELLGEDAEQFLSRGAACIWRESQLVQGVDSAALLEHLLRLQRWDAALRYAG